MSEQNKSIVRRALEEVYSRGNLDVVDDLVSEDFVAHSSGPDVHGREEMKQYVQSLRTAFPDLQMSIDDQVAEGDKVVTRWTATGTHTGPFQGIPPTGKRGSLSGIDIDYVVDGKTIECWTISDDLSLLQQLGVLDSPQSVTQ
jgi:steroid delta-isomerase-like uncharacterized protein